MSVISGLITSDPLNRTPCAGFVIEVRWIVSQHRYAARMSALGGTQSTKMTFEQP